MSQRNFTIVGQNIFKIATSLCLDQNLCRLLYYTDRTPLSKDKPNLNGLDILHKNILIVPKPPDKDLEKNNYLVVLFDNFYQDSTNDDFKVSSVRFNIICPFDEWLIEEQSLRPYMIMERVDKLFNKKRISGIGTLKFSHAQELIISPQLGGYNMEYEIVEFN